MRDGFINLYERDEQYDFRRLVDCLGRWGLEIIHPLDKALDLVDLVAPDGDQILTPRARVFELADARPDDLSLQFWLDDCQDVYCRLRFDGPWVLTNLRLNGLEEDGLRSTVDAVLEYLLGADRGTSRGMVIDIFNRTGYQDWDTFLLQRDEPILRNLPDVLVLEASRSPRIEPRALRGHSRREMNGLVLYEVIGPPWGASPVGNDYPYFIR